MVPAFFEVHLWPIEGRILVINNVYGAQSPVLTFLTVGLPDGSAIGMVDATVVTACALANAGNPAGNVIEHCANGAIIEIDATSLRTLSVLRSVPAVVA